ncbi:hypothetical protein CPB83DRAFT_566046 [Crepidotus variabilis]|uniref:Uncharacterized protein n=1 Tax=Crepidotus variabilis TaxID=179855 RepID=A0A9P6E9J8_9AGAR|nr:hypothetical protein CPB83DRAFT_566046 [Crepidotus variabilis]
MFRSTSTSSANPSTSPTRRSRLDIAGVSNLFVRVRRLEQRALRRNTMSVLTSGDPKTHTVISSNENQGACLPVEYVNQYVCTGGVNVAPLLRATRTSLLGRVEVLGANALMDEQWECTIYGPKHNTGNGTYTVQVRYLASATKSAVCDPCRPVALEQAKGIPGLMTIVKRSDA